VKKVAYIFTILLVIAVAATAYINLTPSRGWNNETVHVGVPPDQDPATLRASFGPLLDYLQRQTKLDFELLVPDDYRHLVKLFEDGSIQLAYFGGLTFVQAQDSAGAEPLVMREADTRFTASFIVRNEDPWNSCWQLACDELRGSRFTFGSRLSTSGHLMPRHFLQSELGIVPEEFFGVVEYSGAHDQTAINVLNGPADIGALNSAIFSAMSADGRIASEKLVQIWETPPYPNYVWAVQDDFDDIAAASIRDAFLSLSEFDETEKRILDGLRATNFVPASARDFEPLTSIARGSGLLD
jgi:phosphonate transport system substrate-binding protein